MITQLVFPLLIVGATVLTWTLVMISLIGHLFYWLLFDLFDRVNGKIRKLERNSDDRDDE